MSKNLPFLWVLFIFLSWELSAQKLKDTVKYTPYELMSTFYNQDFKPFKRKNVYIGLSLSLEDNKMKNTTNIIQTVIDGDNLDYSIFLKGGYYTGNYGMVGLNFNYTQRKFEGLVYREPDTLQIRTIERGYELTPNFRSSIPLTKNERLSFYTQIGTTFGYGNYLRREVKNVDEVNKTYATNFKFRLGISPGITFFAMESFAFEVQLDLLGYELNMREETVNDGKSSTEIDQSIDFNIDILSLQMGLAYYFGSKK